MENKILFSIITVSFNSVKTIERTILSVLNQGYKNFEYIVIDGGSTDGTIDIIKKYQDKLAYWVSEKDGGISEAFNKGIKISQGKIIGILNSDDWYELDALNKIAKLDFENSGDFYVGTLKYWNLKEESVKVVYPDTNYKKTISFRMPHLNHPASFFKVGTYNDIGLFDCNYKYAMDYDIFLRAFLKDKQVVFTNDVIANMLMGGAANANKQKAYWEVFLISKNKVLGFVWYCLSLLRMFFYNL